MFSNNHLIGSIPDFTGCPSLIILERDRNKFSGRLPKFEGCSSLSLLLLGGNQITEWRMESLRQLSHLKELDLSRNRINSAISHEHLSNVSKLKYIDTSFNPLTFHLSPEWLPPFRLVELSFVSCRLGPKFPRWIRNQTRIERLDFSNSQISDTIPRWFWNLSSTMIHLNLSSNNIKGTISSKLFTEEMDLNYNYFEGLVPHLSSKCSRINLSQNRFSGRLLSLSVVEDMFLTYLDLSHNLLSGALPDRWVYFKGLAFLNLGYNRFSGRIPVSMGHLASLQTLILRNNRFYGDFPASLRNCSKLSFVDFGFNMLSGIIPAWIGEDLTLLYALILRSNKFSGNIPYHICCLSDLHFLDLSTNRISGTVPECIGNLTAMIRKGSEITEHYFNYSYGIAPTASSTYFVNALASWKGQVSEYERNFAYLKMIDFSTNEFSGEIPIGITRLLDLRGLNLSRNKFYGKLPSEIGKLKMLESLDLSRNIISGEIPQTMSGLNFLGYLDLSSNNFSGKIPSGTQLEGFNASTYEGNLQLCGPPLTKICPGDEADDKIQPSFNGNEVDKDENIEYKRWLYTSAVLGFVTTLCGICSTLVFHRRWRRAYFLFLENLKDQVYVIMAVLINRLRT